MYMSMYMYSYVQVWKRSTVCRGEHDHPARTYNASISSHAGHLLVNAKAYPQLQSAQP